MNLHPALLAVIIVDLLAAVTLIVAAWGAVRVVLRWDSTSASRHQLELERVSEVSSALGRLGLGLVATAALLLVVVLNHILPLLVPGAMCGVGALQAMPGGTVALAVRGLALAVLWVWAVIDSLDRSVPRAPLTVASARTLLIATPIAIVAVWQTSQSLLHVDVQHPVSCCAAVYDLASSHERAASGLPQAGLNETVVAMIGALAITAGAGLLRRKSRNAIPAPIVTMLWAGLAILWSGLAVWTLVDVGGPYLYRALGHRCPLCFFLPHHGAVGYALYGALAGVLAEALTAATSAYAGSRSGEVREAARTSLRRATLGATLGVVLFVVLSASPAIAWRLRFGVWIDG